MRLGRTGRDISLKKPFAAFDDQYVYAYGKEVFNRTKEQAPSRPR